MGPLFIASSRWDYHRATSMRDRMADVATFVSSS